MGAHSGIKISGASDLDLNIDIASEQAFLVGGPEDYFGDGNFPGGANMATESGSNAQNDVVEFRNPGGGYALRQTMGVAQTEYQLNPSIPSSFNSTPLCMSGWYAQSSDYTGGGRMFHSRTYSSAGSHTALGTGTGTLVAEKTVDETDWDYRYAILTTPADFTGSTNWYVGYAGTNYTGARYYNNLRIMRGTMPHCIDLCKNYVVYPRPGTSYNSAGGNYSQGSVEISGTDNQVIHVESVDLRKDFSLEIVCKLDAIQGGFFGHGITSARQGLHITMANNYTRFGMYGNDTDFSLPHQTNVWAHYVFTYNHSTFVKNAYRNGISYSGNTIQTQTSYTAAPNILRIGQPYSTYSTTAMNGKVAIARMYNKVLTGTEVKNNFAAIKKRFEI